MTNTMNNAMVRLENALALLEQIPTTGRQNRMILTAAENDIVAAKNAMREMQEREAKTKDV